MTHFLSDKDTYFELQLIGSSKELKERGNDTEMINYRPTNSYYQISLSHVDSLLPDFFKGRMVIVGFLRDSLITPRNEGYGRPADEINGDMSDIQISANIISTIKNKEFIDHAKPGVRITIVLFIGLLNTLLLRLSRSRYNAVNILLAIVFFVVLNRLSTMLIVYLFAIQNYYLNLDEVTAVLFVISAASLYWNTRDNEKRNASEVGNEV